MAASLLISVSFFQPHYQKQFLYLILALSFLTLTQSALSQTNCVLDIEFPVSEDNSTCTGGDWDGLFNNGCCKSTYNAILYALGKNTNETGKIFLTSSEENKCLTSMKGIDGNVSNCGLEKLTSGGGGCSDYAITDVVHNLGNKMRELGEDCEVLGSNGESNINCSACSNSFEEIRVSANDSKAETDVCKLAVLITLTSQRVDDEKWVQALYQCLGRGSLALDDKKSLDEKPKKSVPGHRILVEGIVGIILIVTVAIAVWMLSRRFKKGKFSVGKDALEDPESEDSSCHKISIKDVYSATNNLNALNFIGQGIAGKVYKGVLSDGQHVAVKHIINDGQMETFVREVTSLSYVRHPNLVTILGHCMGEEECFLVYELCEKGNLSEWLFGKDKSLSWTQRLEIAIDCARGLWFLHTYPQGCIVHRDIKPTNILLCSNYQGKLSDFGLSKVIAVDKSYVSSEVRGTFGYVDPEYRQNHRVNSSGDVYSFGIVILQLISGQRVINLDANKPMPLNKMAKTLTRGGNIIDFADPKLKGNFSEEAFESVLKLALTCTGIKQQRPSMEKVYGKLKKALSISTHDESDVPS